MQYLLNERSNMPLVYIRLFILFGGSQVALVVKNPSAIAGDVEKPVWFLGWEHPLEGEMATHSNILLPGEFHGQSSLVDYSPGGRKELDMTELICHTFTYA